MRFSSVLQNIFTVLLLWFLITSNEGTQSMKLRCVCDTHTMSELEASLLKKKIAILEYAKNITRTVPQGLIIALIE